MSDNIEKKIKDLIQKYGLENAIKHNGKANDKAVMQKIMATHTDIRPHSKKVNDLIEELIPPLNELSLDAQIEKLTKIAPELLKRKVTEKKVRELPPLKDAIKGKVVTRYAPEPNGEMHLGHAYTAFFAHHYANRYDGTFILRFEDTNPKQAEIKYYEAHRESLEWLGLNPGKEVIVSNDIPIFHEKAEELIKKGQAYTCTCPVEEMRDLRSKMQSCEHAKKKPEAIMKEWNKMLKGEYEEGEIVLRLRGDMQSQNAVMRDPAILMIRKDAHCLQNRKYNVWPLYDFANAIEDKICGVTHVGRSAEFDTRIELQNKIRELLGLLPQPHIFHYARFNVIGSPASKRKIKPLVEEGKVEGWDDIRLVTVKGLKKRGIVPETIKQIALEVGMTTQPTNIDWSLISATNRKLIDLSSNRYFFVPDPVILFVAGLSEKRVKDIPLHPDDPKRGTRKIETGSFFFIPRSDYDKLKKGQEFRLKDLYNVNVINKKADLNSEKDLPKKSAELKNLLKKYPTHLLTEYTDEELKPGPKIQWVIADSLDTIDVQVKVPDVLFINDVYNENSMKIVDGIGEKAIASLKVDDIVQFERFGFVRINRKEENKIFVNQAHK
ncbi:MAG: glutamate--tRNA ligase [Candidatus Heimdallarchaeota archaeon]|nr:glutamate--tRNA ligase [Candidatus Heimdallarchaeota archaeon]